jgi:hypothetical protein
VTYELYSIITLIALHRWLDNSAVPNSVKVRLPPNERHRYFIATTVVIVGGMEELVDITNEMHEVLERFESLSFWDPPVCRHALELFNLRRSVPRMVNLTRRARLSKRCLCCWVFPSKTSPYPST